MPIAIINIIALIIQLLPQILSQVGVITPKLSGLIEQLGAAVPGLISAVVTNGTIDDKVLAVLSGLQAELRAIGNSLNLPPVTLQRITSLDNGITAALEEYVEAKSKTDPSTLTPLPETL